MQRRRIGLLNINNEKQNDPRILQEIKSVVARNERDRELCKELNEFQSWPLILRHYLVEAKKRNSVMISTPPPFGGILFDDLLPNFMK